MAEQDGEFRGATRAELAFLKDALRDVRGDLAEISKVLSELRDFKTKVLAYAGLAAAAATFGIQFIMEKVGG